ncbi:MAG: GNAT family N-acetyltransferase [Caldilineaceae bacterium]
MDQSNIQIRPPQMEDIQAAFDLIAASDIAEYGEPDIDMDELAREWSDVNLERDAWLLFTERDGLVGYGIAFDDVHGEFGFDYYFKPGASAVFANARLIELCEARIREWSGMRVRNSQTASAQIYMPIVNRVACEGLAAAGYAPHHYVFRMEIVMDDAPAIPTWPDEIELRTVNADRDDRAVYDFARAAFDWRAQMNWPPFSQWRSRMIEAANFDDSLWFLLFHQGELIGSALCYDYDLHGWVRQLAVAKTWRRQGLGARLLQHAFYTFYQRGHQRVALGVEADNANAYAFYEGIGMQRVREFVAYKKEILF